MAFSEYFDFSKIAEIQNSVWRPNLSKNSKSTQIIWVFIVLRMYNFGLQANWANRAARQAKSFALAPTFAMHNRKNTGKPDLQTDLQNRAYEFFQDDQNSLFWLGQG